MTLGSTGAMCRVGSGEGNGEGSGEARRDFFAFVRATFASRPWVLRAGLVVRDRVTLDLRCFFAATRAFRAVVVVFRRAVALRAGLRRGVAFFAVPRRAVAFFAALPVFRERGAFAREREDPAFEREVALERVLRAA